MDNPSLIIQSFGLIVSIFLAVAFAVNVKSKINSKEKFSGVSWGIVNGIFGIGILWVLIAHNSINKEITKIKDKKYKKFVEQEMKYFTRTYGICLIISLILVSILMSTIK